MSLKGHNITLIIGPDSYELMEEYDQKHEDIEPILYEVARIIQKFNFIKNTITRHITCYVGSEEESLFSALNFLSYNRSNNGAIFYKEMNQFKISFYPTITPNKSIVSMADDQGNSYMGFPCYPYKLPPNSTYQPSWASQYAVSVTPANIGGMSIAADNDAFKLCDHEYVNISFYEGPMAKYQCKKCGREKL